jgi:hypothetical protein
MFKKINFVILALFITCLSQAQFKKGDRMVGVSIIGASFNSGNSAFSFPGGTSGYDTKSNSFSISLNPSLGWFINEKTVIGASINAGTSSNKLSYVSRDTTFSQNKSSQLTLGIGGFIRNYFKTEPSSLMPFIQASVNFGTGGGKNEGFNFSTDAGGKYKDTFDGKASGVAFANAALSGGFTKMVGQHVGLDFFIGYNYSYNKKTSKTTTVRSYTSGGGVGFTAVYEPTEKFTSNGASIGIGFQIFLDTKKK